MGSVQVYNQGRYIVGSGANHGQLKGMETLQKEIEMPEKESPVVNPSHFVKDF